MKRLFLLYLFIYSIVIIQARCEISEKKAKADSLLESSDEEVLKVNPKRSVEFAMEALELSEAAKYCEGRAKACFRIADALFNLGDYKEALEYLSLAEKEKKVLSGNPFLASEIIIIRGRIFGSMGLNENSLQEFHKGLKYIKKIKEKDDQYYLLALSYDNLIEIFKITGKHDSVLVYINKGIKLLEQMDESSVFRSRINIYSCLGEYYTTQNNFDSAALCFNHSLLIAEKYQFPYISKTYILLGNMELERGDVDSALNFFFKALKNPGTINYKVESPCVYNNISRCYELKGIEDSAVIYNELALKTENIINNNKVKAAEFALNIILKDKIGEKSKNNRCLLCVAAFFLILLLLITNFYFVQKKRSRKIIISKETEAKKLEKKLNNSFIDLIQLGKIDDPAFISMFREVYPEFTEKLLGKHPDLTISELKLCAMIFLNFTSKEIAQSMFIQHRSVQTKKSRLRKKLKIMPGEDLQLYFKSLV